MVADGDDICSPLLLDLLKNPFEMSVFFVDTFSSTSCFFFLLFLFLYTSLVAKKLPSRNTGEPKKRTSKSFEIT